MFESFLIQHKTSVAHHLKDSRKLWVGNVISTQLSLTCGMSSLEYVYAICHFHIDHLYTVEDNQLKGGWGWKHKWGQSLETPKLSQCFLHKNSCKCSSEILQPWYAERGATSPFHSLPRYCCFIKLQDTVHFTKNKIKCKNSYHYDPNIFLWNVGGLMFPYRL